MRKARFTEEHMVAIIREVNRPHVGGGEAARGQRTTIYSWRRRFDGFFQAIDVRRLET
jgi:hypothetical protein